MNGRIVVGDTVRPLSGKYKGQEGSVVDVYNNKGQCVRVRFSDNSLEIYEGSQVELTNKTYNFKRLLEEL